MKRSSLEIVECGHCRHAEAMTRRGAAWRGVDFPALVGVIHHAQEGVILYDTGYDAAFMDATRALPERLYRLATPVTFAPGESIVDQLATRGIPADAVRHIILSHFHGDHVAGLHNFPHATLHCACAGLRDLRARSRFGSARRGLLPALVPDRIDHAAFFEDATPVALPAAFQPFDRGADLLGDASLLAVELPGHCPGHWGLALRLEDDRYTLLVGDAAWSLTAIERNMPPPGLVARLLGDAAVQRSTLAALHRLHGGRPDTLLLPSHCSIAARQAGLQA
ncbi:MAG: MBL fold metallo-hydrolase [Sphingomonas sp.]|nr:MAG: MBL fold metallo-hydrolase [Sphingomonas sp.]